VPMDPDGLAARLERAGFEQVDVRTNEYGWAARARARGG
jgi:predicted methyltransferase